MARTRILASAAAALALALPMAAHAAVTYDFVVTTGWPAGSSFVLTVADPIDDDIQQFEEDARFGPEALTSCNVVNPINPAATLCKGVLFFLYSGGSNLAFGLSAPGENGTSFINYHFDVDAFYTNGVHAGATEGNASLATLTVSGVVEDIGDAPYDPPAVPEPASWALMIGGLGLAGAALRRRARPVMTWGAA